MLNVLKGIHRALKADGVHLMHDIRGSSHVRHDIDHPIGTSLSVARFPTPLDRSSTITASLPTWAKK